MRGWRISFLLVLGSLFLTSCGGRLAGLVSSSDVDHRFEESRALPEPVAPVVGDGSFSFVVVTDPHIRDGKHPNLEALAGRLLPSDRFVLVCGDIADDGGRGDLTAFRAIMARTGLPFYSAVGNHDLFNNGWDHYRELQGRDCYTWTAGSLRVICLDTANGTLGAKQRSWLESVLRAKSEPLCLVFTHFELIAPKIDDLQQFTDQEEIYYLMDLFERNGVGLYLAGHAHDNDFHEVNGVGYLTVDNFRQEGAGVTYIRVNIDSGKMTYMLNEI